MSEPIMVEPTSPTAGKVIKLWMPRNIFWLGIFLGWPTSLVLSIINWFRMGLWKKAFTFIGVGLLVAILFFSTSFKLPENSSSFPLLLFNFLLLFSFQSLMKIDFNALGYTNANVKPAGIGWGILIGILTLAVLFGGLLLILMTIDLVNFYLIPTPNALTGLPLRAASLLFLRS